MTDLSPAAIAVRDAAERQTDLDFRYAPMIAAAALRAAVDQVVPSAVMLEYYERNESPVLGKALEIRGKLLAIAAELRGQEAPAQPEPLRPTDEELVQLAVDTRLYRFQATARDPIQYEMTEQQIHAFARAVLDRWGQDQQNKETIND